MFGKRGKEEEEGKKNCRELSIVLIMEVERKSLFFLNRSAGRKESKCYKKKLLAIGWNNDWMIKQIA